MLQHNFFFTFNDAIVTVEPSTDFGSLSVKHESHSFACSLASFTEDSSLFTMGFVVTVREVQATNVHASVDQFSESINSVAGGSHCANNFGAAFLSFDLFKHVVELDVSRVTRRHFVVYEVS